MELIENEHIKNITNILKNIGETVEGNLLCDIYPDNWVYQDNIEKIKNIQNMCKNKKKIVEIGVNACHSLIIMLLENPNAEYLLFDLNYHKYTNPIINYVKENFPNTNINIIYGNSVETINKYILENENELNTYDLCHLDGGHTEDIFSFDYEHMKKLIKKDGYVIFDDYDYNEIQMFIQRKLNENEIKEYINNIIKTNKQFIYQYI